MTATLILPYPSGISVNHYYKRSIRGVFLDKKVIDYREGIYYTTLNLKRFGKAKLDISIDMYPPDNRKRDVDNILKAVLDALQYCGIYKDDSQIMKLCIRKKGSVENGFVLLLINEFIEGDNK